MTRLAQAFKEIRGYHWLKIPYLDAAERYVETGDRAALAKVKPASQQDAYWGRTLAGGVGRPPGWGDADRRAIHVLAAAQLFDGIGVWLDGVLRTEKPEDDFHAQLRQELQTARVATDDIIRLTVRYVVDLARAGRLTSGARYLLSLSDDQLREGVRATEETYAGPRFLEFLLATAPQRVPPLVGDFLAIEPKRMRPQIYGLLLKKGGSQFEPQVRAAFERESDTHTKFGMATELFELAPDRYGAPALAAARASFSGPAMSNNHHQVGPWMVEHFGRDVLPDMVAFLSSADNEHAKPAVLSATAQALGSDAAPAVLAAIAHGRPETKLAALPHLFALDEASHLKLIQDELTAGMAHADAALVVKFIGAAARWDVAQVQETLWSLLDHKSKPVRDSAARTLGKLGSAAVPRASGLLQARRAATRLAAVVVLAAIKSPQALETLETRLDSEEDEDVRDAILLALQAAWRAAGRTIRSKDIEARITRLASKLGSPPAGWIKEAKLPPLETSDGRRLSLQETRYLLFRQSRAKAIAADVEVAPFLALLDRKSSGDFALELLKGFLGSGASADDRWVLALTGLLGDDRIVPILSRQIRDWADHARGKLAEYAVQGLALLGSDEALLTVDSIAIRYRTKNKNIGKAAVEAFASAAEGQGLTPDELGDRVVPWLGFEPDQQRIVATGAKQVEVAIGLDFKLSLRDAGSKKKMASLPKTAPKETLAEIKDLTASLREIVKAQTMRLENLMVRQRRWPAGRWREMFLRHPLLIPFAARLVWGHYGDGEARPTTFRALEDRTLTDASDSVVTLPPSGSVGIVHPLELADAERQAWRAHLADHEVSPAFPQMDRPVLLVAPEETTARSYAALRGTALNGMTFKGRAERLGWQRGSVCDGGGVTSYWKGFPASGCDAFLGLEDMWIGIDMYATIKLQDLLFVRTGSVQIGSYVYDDPDGERDPRVIPFGEVPAIAFSEVMGDLKKIAAKSGAADD
jgi:hypothetical protein